MFDLWPLAVYFFPIIGIILILLTPREDVDKLKIVALKWSLYTFTITILLWSCVYDGTIKTIFSISWVSNLMSTPLNVYLAVDGISIFFLVLTGLLIPVCILVSWNSITFLVKEYLLCLLLIEVLLMGVFTVWDLVAFYILFEGILIPMFLIIGVWGSREEKVKAAYYFFFYTFIGSVFMLLAIFMLYSEVGTTDYRTLCCVSMDKTVQYFVFAGFFFSLAVKIPMVPFHIWLPLAHVEAPIAGSVILAGVLLKIGGYGFIRFSWPMLPDASEYFSPLIQALSVLAIIYASLITCRQVDLKRIIAYSSVSHMGLVTSGIFSHTVVGIEGAIALMIAHGLVSSGLFIMVTFLYERHNTRLVRYYRGVGVTMSIWTVVFISFILANIGFPPSFNFAGEFVTLIGPFEYSYIVGVFASLGMVLSAAYSLYLSNRLCFAEPSKYLAFTRDLNRREFYSVSPLLLLTFLLGVCPTMIYHTVHTAAMLCVT